MPRVHGTVNPRARAGARGTGGEGPRRRPPRMVRRRSPTCWVPPHR